MESKIIEKYNFLAFQQEIQFTKILLDIANNPFSLDVGISPFYLKKQEKPIVKYVFPAIQILETWKDFINEKTLNLLYNITKPSNVITIEFDNEDAILNAELCYMVLKHLHLDSLILYTGNKSFHIWIPLLENVNNEILQVIYNYLKDNLPIDLDLNKFDKQVFFSYKNKIRLPFTIHHKTLTPSFFLKNGEIDLKNFIEEEDINYLIKKALKEEILVYEKEILNKSGLLFLDIDRLKIENQKKLNNLIKKEGLEADFSWLFEDKKESKIDFEIRLYEENKGNISYNSKERIARKIINLLNQNLKEGKQRAVGVLYALSVLLNKDKDWFYSIAKKLPYYDKVKSKVESYYNYYDNYKKSHWVNWGWIFNRIKEIKQENGVIE